MFLIHNRVDIDFIGRMTQVVKARLVAAGLLSCLLAACTAFDPLDQTGPSINRTEADYANDATLLNVVRATRQEPLTFITITGIDGTASITGSLGLATVTLGPLAATAKRDYAFGPNSIGRSYSNTFHVSVVDDPTSFAGLMAPINPAVLAFLLRQGYKPSLLFFLLTSEIREVEVDPATGETTRVIRDYMNDPKSPADYGSFIGKMATLLFEGLVAQVDATAFPSSKTMPASKLCMDEVGIKPAFGTQITNEEEKHPILNRGSAALCERAPWIEADASNATSNGLAAGGNSTSLTSLGVSKDGSLWATVGPKNQLIRVSSDGKVVAVHLPAGMIPTTPPKKTLPSHIAAFPFQDVDGHHYEILFRSTIGAYYYIGAYNTAPIDNLLAPDGSGSGSLINLKSDSPSGCFAETSFHGKHFCVPEDAENTKQLFSVLHLLQELQTAPSNSPTTLSVTPVP